jgi:hypothetical protein
MQGNFKQYWGKLQIFSIVDSLHIARASSTHSGGKTWYQQENYEAI